jgi:hypothetical protein
VELHALVSHGWEFTPSLLKYFWIHEILEQIKIVLIVIELNIFELGSRAGLGWLGWLG